MSIVFTKLNLETYRKKKSMGSRRYSIIANTANAELRLSRSWMIDPDVITHSSLAGLSSTANDASTFTADQVSLREMWADLLTLQKDVLNVEELLIMTKPPDYIKTYLAAIKPEFRRLREELLERFGAGASPGTLRAAVDTLQVQVRQALEDYTAELYS